MVLREQQQMILPKHWNQDWVVSLDGPKRSQCAIVTLVYNVTNHSHFLESFTCEAVSTVEPLYNGHPWDPKFCPL